MESYTINGSTFVELLKYGYKNLFVHYEAINDLNVFPVPDGDTGTNMKLTYQNGLKRITDDDAAAGKIADEVAGGMLFGARGNSGVLTSQYFRGLANSLMHLEEIGVKDFAEAMVSAYRNAYKACVDVAEGTILTVAREGIENVKYEEGDDFATFLGKVVDAMKVSLDNTPNLLPVLKENGVIDSGGKGLLTIFEGYLYFFTGKEIREDNFSSEEEEEKHDSAPAIDYSAFNEDSVLDYGYCTEFLLQLLNSKIDIPSFDIDAFIAYLQEHGESLVCFQTGTIVKVHIHTKKPYEVIEFAQRYGEFVTFKMENMALQHNQVIKEEERKMGERKHLAYIAIAQGDGIIDTFKEMGCDIVLNGGQTMNASVSEMIDAFKYANADEIILLPNETNMCKAAHQAAELYKDSVVKVIDTKTLQEGYFLLSVHLNIEDEDSSFEVLSEYLEALHSASVFKSAKEAVINGEKVDRGHYVEAIGHNLIGYSDDLATSSIDLVSKLHEEYAGDILFIIYGQTVRKDDATDIMLAIKDKFPNLDITLVSGKQDVYDLLFGLVSF